MWTTGSPRVTHNSVPHIPYGLSLVSSLSSPPTDRSIQPCVYGLCFASESFSPCLTALDLFISYAPMTNGRGGFEPPRTMRCRAHLFVSTRLENVFTPV